MNKPIKIEKPEGEKPGKPDPLAELIAAVEAHRRHHAEWQRDDTRPEVDADYYESLEIVLEAAAAVEDRFSRPQAEAVANLRKAYDDQLERLGTGRREVGNFFWLAWHQAAATF
jgi:hypothetical protein